MTDDTSVVMNYMTRASVSGAWVNKTARYDNFTNTFSINHYPLDTSTDDGGPWMLQRVQDRPSFGFFNGMAPNNLTYHGPISVQAPSSWVSLSPVNAKTDGELDSFGTTAMSRTAPTNPSFDLATALGELASDGLPSMVGASLWKERAQLARGAGSEYLNLEFGWKPLMRDIQGFARSVKDSHQIISSYRKGSDKKIRVAYEGGSDGETKSATVTNMQSSPAYTIGPGSISQTIVKRQWFKGAFRYHVPVPDTAMGKFHNWASMADHLLGVKPTPETLWNIAPWSWAADWFGTTGAVMTNISNLGRDGLVLQYGYSMAHSVRTTQMTGTFTARYNQRADASRSTKTEWKQRRPATPYGFGVNLQTLSAKQMAIIAALGLSKT